LVSLANPKEETMPTQTLTKDSLSTKLLLKALVAFKKGDFSVRLPGEWTGEAGKIADTFNDIIELSDRTTKEVGKARLPTALQFRQRLVPGSSSSSPQIF
jgi:hypothetical protein